MTCTFDYTVVFAIGSLVAALAGASVYYFGALINGQKERLYNKIGYVRKYDTVKHYTYSLLFLSFCVICFSIISLIISLIILPYIAHIPIVSPPPNLTTEIYTRIYNFYFIAIYNYYSLALALQFVIFLWAALQISWFEDDTRVVDYQWHIGLSSCYHALMFSF